MVPLVYYRSKNNLGYITLDVAFLKRMCQSPKTVNCSIYSLFKVINLHFTYFSFLTPILFAFLFFCVLFIRRVTWCVLEVISWVEVMMQTGLPTDIN